MASGRSLRLVIGIALVVAASSFLPSSRLRDDTALGILRAGFGKPVKAAPKFNGKTTIERHMRAFIKGRAADWSNTVDVYVKADDSEKFW